MYPFLPGASCLVCLVSCLLSPLDVTWEYVTWRGLLCQVLSPVLFGLVLARAARLWHHRLAFSLSR